MPSRISAALLLTFLSIFAVGQAVPGPQPYGTFGGGPIDTINLGNLNVHLEIPIVRKAGRGVPFDYTLAYDSSVWYPSGGVWTKVGNNWGWKAKEYGTTGETKPNSTTVDYCRDQFGHVTGSTTHIGDWSYNDPWNARHHFPGEFTLYSGSCVGTNVTHFTASATDGSGLTLDATYGGSYIVSTTTNVQRNSTSVLVTDANGNQISSNGTAFTDTLGTTALTTAGLPPNPVTLTYTAPSGAAATVTINYTTYNIKTNFGCTGVTEANITGDLVTSIVLPDGGTYSFAYESTPGFSGYVTGRIRSITVPTGGSITYTYTGANNGIVCKDGSTIGFQRQISPGGTWTYSRTNPSGTRWQTTIDDPAGNRSILNLQVVYHATITSRQLGVYETQRQAYTGTTSLLNTVNTCYNGAAVPCTGTSIALPITRRTIYNYLPDSAGKQAKTDVFYTGVGLVSEVDDYGFGNAAVGSLIRKTLITWTSLGNNIVRPTEIKVLDSAGAQKGRITHTYDEGSVTATTGTPQHIAVTGARGNLTSASFQATASPVAYLYRKFTHYDTGTINTSTDFSTSSTSPGPTTTYNYASGSPSCSNSFVTSISLPLSLTRSMTWDCVGGVMTSGTDENGKTATITYNDAYFWRPANTTDPNGNVTSLNYISPNAAESSMMFNAGNSVVGQRTTLDGLGRVILQQTAQGPGATNYDSVQADYGSTGTLAKVTLPFVAAAGSTCSGTCPGTTFTYDGLGRVLSSADSGGGSVTYSYTKNDIYRTLAPAPVGEQTKRKQLEYDSLGRLTSVCEITTLPGNGSCGQTVTQTGYWTKYQYDVLDNLTTVTQNAQSTPTQSRTFAYDPLSRLITETHPESGSSNYTYDTITSGLCAGTFAANLIKATDAVGNTTCYQYDNLARPTAITYNGPYATQTSNKYYVYDAATVDGTTMTNVVGRVAEAYTSTCQTGCTKITDLGFSYSSRGEPTLVYQKSPNSGTPYYHINTSYWEHGLMKQLSGLPGLPTINYGVDSEGRYATVSATSGQSPVTATSYNSSSQPTGVTFGSLDSDVFSYDSNTGRMTQFQFQINGQNVTSTLSWNQDGKPSSLSVTDPFNAANTQACNFSHDDLGRITSFNCGATCSGAFTFDVYGNITKSGSTSFQPTYSSSTNRMTSLPGFTPTYDANGNLTADSFHTYSWNADGDPVTVDAVTITYDAFGRPVEQSSGGTYTQIAYLPFGTKLALMNAQALQEAYVHLPGNSTAIYGATGLSRYRHPDWLGSARFSSTPARNMSSSTAYGPYGEAYSSAGTADLSFTGQDQDTVTGLYDFPLREYSPTQGRWSSPDPIGLAAVDLGNPQSFDQYAYVGNDPLDFIDPDGACLYDIYSMSAANGGCGMGFQGPNPGCASGGYGCGGWADYDEAASYLGNGFSAGLSWMPDDSGLWNEHPPIDIIYPTIWEMLFHPPCAIAAGESFMPCGGLAGVPGFGFNSNPTKFSDCLGKANVARNQALYQFDIQAEKKLQPKEMFKAVIKGQIKGAIEGALGTEPLWGTPHGAEAAVAGAWLGALRGIKDQLVEYAAYSTAGRVAYKGYFKTIGSLNCVWDTGVPGPAR